MTKIRVEFWAKPSFWLGCSTLVVQVEPGQHDDGVATIEGLEETLLETRIVGSNGVILCGIEEGIVLNHVFGHVVCPLEDLGADVHQEGVGRPVAKDHPGADRFVSDIEGAEAEGLVPAKVGADKPQEMPDKIVVN
jgi:hypothetical protein